MPIYVHSGFSHLAGFVFSVGTGYEYYTFNGFKTLDISSINLISGINDPFSGPTGSIYISVEMHVPDDIPDADKTISYSYGIALTSLSGGVPDEYKPIIKVILFAASIAASIIDSVSLPIITEASKMYVDMGATVNTSLTHENDQYVYTVTWDGGNQIAEGAKIKIRFNPMSTSAGSGISDKVIYIKIDADITATGNPLYTEVDTTYPLVVRTGSVNAGNAEYYTCTDPLYYYPAR